MADCKGLPEIILIATGSEVQFAIGAYEKLTREGIRARVVSLPCWSLFERQGDKYWEKVLPTSVRCRVVVEAASSFGWRRYTGIDADSVIVAQREFGESAPLQALLEEFGFTTDRVYKAAKEALRKNAKAKTKTRRASRQKTASKKKVARPKTKIKRRR